MPQEIVEIAPAAVACGDIDNAVAGIEIGFEHVAGKGFVFGGGLAEVEARAADEEAVQGIAGAVAFGDEALINPVLFPMFGQFAEQVAFGRIHG